MIIQKCVTGDFPGGPVVKNPPCNAGDAGLIPGQGTKIPHAAGQLSQRASTRARMPWSLRATTREKPTHHNKEPAPHN